MIKGRLVIAVLLGICARSVFGAQETQPVASPEVMHAALSDTLVPPPPAPPAPVAPRVEEEVLQEPVQQLVDTQKDTQASEPEPVSAHVALTPQERAHIRQSLESEVALNFNNVSLQSIADQMSEIFHVTFLPDDVVKVPDKQIRALAESKISFKTRVAFTKKEAWALFTRFLELAGWALVPTSDPQFYRITAIDTANKSPLPTYINTDLDILPKSEQRIRYVYFLVNSTPEDINTILAKLISSKTQIDLFTNLRAILITDTAANIYSLMQVVQELDKTTSPQVLSVVNLREAEASEVVDLMDKLRKKDEPSASVWMPVHKEASLYYFPKDVRLIAMPRTNALVIVGPKEGVERFEHFIMTYIDASLKQTYQPLNVYELSYAPAEQLATILNEVVKFGKKGSSSGGQTATVGDAGGVLGGLKYFGDVHVEAEKEGNRLLVYASQEDFKHLSAVIKQLDQRQPQVAIEVMIVEIDVDKVRKWGIQWDTKKHRTFDAQMTGFWNTSKAVVQETSTPSKFSNNLIGNLIGLSKIPEAGTMLMTLGKESIYAILGILEDDTYARVVANPFIIATNKYTASVAISEERMAQTQKISGTSSADGYATVEAKWSVSITPQINTEGTVNLDISVTLEDFSQKNSATADPSNANKTVREVQTNANVADKEVIALGGLINRKKMVTKYQTPFFGKIPIIGNLFKNESREERERLLVIFMAPTIIQPTENVTNVYTKNKAQFIKDVSLTWNEQYESNKRDPIYRWLFKPVDADIDVELDAFMKQGTAKKSMAPAMPTNKATVAGQDVIMKSVADQEQTKGNK